MKRIKIYMFVLLLAAGFTASAQMGRQMNRKGMGQMMMQGMMGDQQCPHCGQMMGNAMPMQHYTMMINHLPMMQEQLSLNQQQTNQLIDLQTEFKKQQVDYKAELMKKRMQLQKLLQNDAEAGEIQSQMQECADTRISMNVAAYETVKEMKSVLNQDQMNQMKEMMEQQQDMPQRRGGMRGNMMNQ